MTALAIYEIPATTLSFPLMANSSEYLWGHVKRIFGFMEKSQFVASYRDCVLGPEGDVSTQKIHF
jgi:hypothetical protein